MQESIFNVFGTHNSVAPLKQNMRKAVSTSSGEFSTVPTHIKVKSSSVSGSTPFKRALQDVGNRLQPSQHMPGKEVSRKLHLANRQQTSPSVLKSSIKTPAHKLAPSKENNPVKEPLTPGLKKLSINQGSQIMSMDAFELNAESEIFPYIDDEEGTPYEDLFFPKNERLTVDDIFRIATFWGNAQQPKDIDLSPDVTKILPPCEVPPEFLKPLEVEIPFDAMEPQVPVPDLLCIDSANMRAVAEISDK